MFFLLQNRRFRRRRDRPHRLPHRPQVCERQAPQADRNERSAGHKSANVVLKIFNLRLDNFVNERQFLTLC